jgi:8-oxo-dGTP pyrophosphatase MutT (NUDIX family)
LVVADFLVAAVAAEVAVAGKLLPRHTGRAIVIHDGRLLLMERWRDGLHYFSIPGGGIESGESAEQAAVRELYEETSLTVELIRPVFEMHDGDVIHHIFLAKYISGEPHLPDHAEEAAHMHENNRFKPGWVPLETIAELPFIYWEPLRQPLVNALQNGFSDDVTIVTTESTR